MSKNKAKAIVKEAGKIIDNIFTTKHEKLQEMNESLERNKEDRISAREMYKADSSLQKYFALTFLVIFVVVIIAIIGVVAYFAVNKLEAPEWAVMFFTTVFTAISMKLGTITDFLFGGSKSAEIAERRKK